MLGKNPDGSCRGKGAVKKVASVAKTVGRGVASGGKATGRWVSRNGWNIAGFAVGGICIGFGGLGCALAGGALLAAKTFVTARRGGSAGDHAMNVFSTWVFMSGAAPWGALGLTGRAAIGARAMGEVPALICAAFDPCARPSYPH